EDGIRDKLVTGVQTCALPIYDAADSGAAPDEFSGAFVRADALSAFFFEIFGAERVLAAVDGHRREIQHEVVPPANLSALGQRLEIGRASCRERVEMLVVAVSM